MLITLLFTDLCLKLSTILQGISLITKMSSFCKSKLFYFVKNYYCPTFEKIGIRKTTFKTNLTFDLFLNNTVGLVYLQFVSIFIALKFLVTVHILPPIKIHLNDTKCFKIIIILN